MYGGAGSSPQETDFGRQAKGVPTCVFMGGRDAGCQGLLGPVRLWHLHSRCACVCTGVGLGHTCWQMCHRVKKNPGLRSLASYTHFKATFLQNLCWAHWTEMQEAAPPPPQETGQDSGLPAWILCSSSGKEGLEPAFIRIAVVVVTAAQPVFAGTRLVWLERHLFSLVSTFQPLCFKQSA